MTPVLVDTNVLIDVLHRDPVWAAWSDGRLERAVGRGGRRDQSRRLRRAGHWASRRSRRSTRPSSAHLARARGDPVRRPPSSRAVPSSTTAVEVARGRTSPARLLHRRARGGRRLSAPHARSTALPDVLPAPPAHRTELGRRRGECRRCPSGARRSSSTRRASVRCSGPSSRTCRCAASRRSPPAGTTRCG